MKNYFFSASTNDIVKILKLVNFQSHIKVKGCIIAKQNRMPSLPHNLVVNLIAS